MHTHTNHYGVHVTLIQCCTSVTFPLKEELGTKTKSKYLCFTTSQGGMNILMSDCLAWTSRTTGIGLNLIEKRSGTLQFGQKTLDTSAVQEKPLCKTHCSLPFSGKPPAARTQATSLDSHSGLLQLLPCSLTFPWPQGVEGICILPLEGFSQRREGWYCLRWEGGRQSRQEGKTKTQPKEELPS